MPQQSISIPDQTLVAITANEHLRGTPVVFIHGITASLDMWEPLLPESIRDGRRWISLSLPGHYPAQIDPATFGSWDAVTPAIWADWFETALTQLVGDEPVDVVGWSTGGFTGLTLAAHYPRRARSLMSISGFAMGRWLGWLGFFQRMSMYSSTRWGVRIGVRAVGRSRWWFDRLMDSSIGDASAYRASAAREPTLSDWFSAFAKHDPSVMTELFRKIVRFDLSNQVAQINCPTLISSGTADPYIPVSHTRWIADHVPGAELVLWPGAGHLFFAERTLVYQALLQSWLERQGRLGGDIPSLTESEHNANSTNDQTLPH